MLKLSKYELRKNRNALLLLLGGLLLLEILFCFELRKPNDTSLAPMYVVILTLYSLVCYFAVFLFAVTNYHREINSRTSYLVFMTPTSPLKVILSKMLTVLLLGIILLAVLIGVAFLDAHLMLNKYNEYSSFPEMLSALLHQFGFEMTHIVSNLVLSIITFLLSFFSTVALVYLCITLSATLLQNSRFKVVLSIVLFLAGSYAKAKLQSMLNQALKTDTTIINTAADLVSAALPSTALNAVVLLICIVCTTWLLDKKLSL